MVMKFRSESEMQKYVVKRLFKDIKQLFDITKTHLFEEFPYSAGKTDLVVVNLSQKYLYRRINEKNITKSITNSNILKIYLRLREFGSIDQELLHQLFDGAKSTTSRAIKWLKDNNYIEVDNNKIKTINIFNKHVTAACAFELKLSNWKTALKQAHRAKAFSNLQFVVLDDNYIQSALRNKMMFEKYNIGLISISPNSKCKVHFYPKKDKPFSKFGEWILNEFTVKGGQQIVRADSY